MGRFPPWKTSPPMEKADAGRSLWPGSLGTAVEQTLARTARGPRMVHIPLDEERRSWCARLGRIVIDLVRTIFALDIRCEGAVIYDL